MAASSSSSSSLLLLTAMAMLLFPLSHSQTCTSQTYSSNYSSCQDLPALRASIHWTYNPTARTLSVAFSAPPARPNGWIAWALNPTGTGMAGAQSLIAFRGTNGSMEVGTYNISSYSSIVPGPISYNVLNRSAQFSSGIMKIFATLELPNGEPVNQIWQVGSSVRSGFPERHDFAQENLSARSSLQVAGNTATGNRTSGAAPPMSGGGGGAAPPVRQGGNETGGSSMVSPSGFGFYGTLVVFGFWIYMC